MENTNEFEPFSAEWEKAMMKCNKKYLVEWLRESFQHQKFLREVVMRANLALPENEQDLVWFEEGISVVKTPEFIEILFRAAKLGKLNFPKRDEDHKNKDIK